MFDSVKKIIKSRVKLCKTFDNKAPLSDNKNRERASVMKGLARIVEGFLFEREVLKAALGSRAHLVLMPVKITTGKRAGQTVNRFVNPNKKENHAKSKKHITSAKIEKKTLPQPAIADAAIDRMIAQVKAPEKKATQVKAKPRKQTQVKPAAFKQEIKDVVTNIKPVALEVKAEEELPPITVNEKIAKNFATISNKALPENRRRDALASAFYNILTKPDFTPNNLAISIANKRGVSDIETIRDAIQIAAMSSMLKADKKIEKGEEPFKEIPAYNDTNHLARSIAMVFKSIVTNEGNKNKIVIEDKETGKKTYQVREVGGEFIEKMDSEGFQTLQMRGGADVELEQIEKDKAGLKSVADKKAAMKVIFEEMRNVIRAKKGRALKNQGRDLSIIDEIENNYNYKMKHDYKKVAKIMNVSVNTIKQVVKNSRKKGLDNIQKTLLILFPNFKPQKRMRWA